MVRLIFNFDSNLVSLVTNIEKCPVLNFTEQIGGKWKLPILNVIRQTGSPRFGKIHQIVEGVSRKVLTDQLKSLEHHGLITRRQFEEVPLRVEYSLTEKANQLKYVFEAIEKWSKSTVE
jgi:DNA-binding HxlR family transcriptional regulator